VETDRPKRKYDASRRRAQAMITRRAILDAAQGLFERDGYVPTTMEAIAAEAGVALKTVYGAFTTKAGLLRAVWDLALKGDTDDAPVAERAWYVAALGEPNAKHQIQLIAHNSVVVKRRIGSMLRVIRSAAEVDPDGAALWDLIQADFYENQRALVAAIEQHGGLRRGLDVATAADILWTLNHPDVWLLLVGERGWTPDEFEAWFAEVLEQQLLRTPPRRRALSAPAGRRPTRR
jgi:AcrR family transcriptional regulator